MEKSAFKDDQGLLWSVYQAGTRPLWEALCRCGLTSEQRRKLGGHLFPGAAEFVELVAFGMEQDPGLFAHIPVCADDLVEEQKEALDLLILSRCLQVLAQLAHDAYLQRHSSVVQRARGVLQQVRAEGARVFFSPEERRAQGRRSLFLHAAQKLLSDRVLQRGRKPRGAKEPAR